MDNGIYTRWHSRVSGLIVDDANEIVARVPLPKGFGAHAQRAARMKLIADAPSMGADLARVTEQRDALAAHVRIILQWTDYHGCVDRRAGVLESARAALAGLEEA